MDSDNQYDSGGCVVVLCVVLLGIMFFLGLVAFAPAW